MTRRRRIIRILSAIALVVAPACATSVEDSGFATVDAHTDSGAQDSSLADSGADPDTSVPNDTGAIDDTGIFPDDTAGGVCTAACATDTDCDSACASYGGVWCCDPGSSMCFQPSTGVCGGSSTGDDGGTTDGGTD